MPLSVLPASWKKTAKPQGTNTKCSDSPLHFLKQVLSPPRMDSESVGTHTDWQLSTSEETFGRDTQHTRAGS